MKDEFPRISRRTPGSRYIEIAAIALLAYILLLLSTGIGQVGIIALKLKPLSLLLVLFFALILIRFFVKYGTFSANVFFSHAGILLFCLFMIVYLGNGRRVGSLDTIPAQYLPASILRDGDFYLDEFPNLYARGIPDSLHRVANHYVSGYPVGAPVLALPFYLPSVLGSVRLDRDLLISLEKISAAFLTALSAIVFYFSLLFLTDRRPAVFLTLIYALCSSSFSISSQALWQHGPAQLALVSAFYCLLRGRTQPRWIKYAGFALAMAIVCRPTNAVIVAVLGIYVLMNHRQEFFRFLILAAPPALFQLWYNLIYFHNLFHTQFPVDEGWITPWGEGILRSLFSPAKGLLVYSPVFLFSLIGMGAVWTRKRDPLLRYLAVASALLLLLFSRWRGVGGNSWGPRHLSDLTPMLTLFLVPWIDLFHKRIWKLAVFGLCCWSFLAHATGVFLSDARWFNTYQIDRHPERVWMLANNPLFFYSKDFWNRCAMKLTDPPTSRNAPNMLIASYRSDVPELLIVAPHKPVKLKLAATNVGRAVWLARSERDVGRVVLVGMWSKDGEPVRGIAFREKLGLDVFPKSSWQFEFQTRSPPEPGFYSLKVGLISQRVANFSKLGSPNMEFAVQVVEPGPGRP